MKLKMINRFQPILSFDGSCGPLTAADWSLKNSLLVMAAVRSELFIWDISNPSKPVLRKTLPEDGIRHVKFANNSESIIATTGLPNYSIKVLYSF